MGTISHETVQKKLQLGQGRLAQAGHHPDAMALALTAIHGALEDFLRLWLRQHPHVSGHSVGCSDRGTTSWRELQTYLRQGAELSPVVRQLCDAIPGWNRARQEVAHGGEYNGSRSDLEAYAAMVARAVSEGIGYREWRGTPTVGPAQDTVQRELLREQRIARLDREWSRERDSYMVQGNNRRALPSRGLGTYLCVFGPGFATVWLGITSGFKGPMFGNFRFFPLIGPLMGTACFAYGIYVFRRAKAFRQAEERFLVERALLTETHSG